MTQRCPNDNQHRTSTLGGIGCLATRKTKTVAIFGGSSAAEDGEAYQLAYSLGQGLAQAGFEVLNGGYDGTMKAASKGAQEVGGYTIGITCPSFIKNAGKPRPPNKFLNEIHPATDLLSRIDTMMKLSGGFVVLDGGTGTLCEFALVWEFVSKGFMPPRPIVLAGRSWDILADRMVDGRASSTKYLHRAGSPTEVIQILNEYAVAGTRARYNRSIGRQQKTESVPLSDSTTTIAQLREIMDQFVTERQWQPFHDPKNLSASIAIEAAELMEHFQWLRTDQLNQVSSDRPKMDAIREEVADVLAYVLSFAGTMNIDLSSALADKMKKNAVKYPAKQFRGRFE